MASVFGSPLPPSIRAGYKKTALFIGAGVGMGRSLRPNEATRRRRRHPRPRSGLLTPHAALLFRRLIRERFNDMAAPLNARVSRGHAWRRLRL